MGLIKCLRSHMPDAEITVLGSQAAKYKDIEEKLGIELRQNPWVTPRGRKWLIMARVSSVILITFDFCRCFLCRLARTFNKSIKTPYEQYDVVIDSNEDNLDEPAMGSRLVITSLLYTLLEWAIFRRPMATTPTDVGPFTTRRARWLARFVFNRMDILALREKVSYDYCQQLGMDKSKISLTGEAAFLLEPAAQEKVELILQQEGITKGDKPFIGFSPSSLEMELFAFSKSMSSEERPRKYVELMAAMTDYLVERLDATVCFIPHVTSAGSDDREVCYRIYEQMVNKQAVRVLRGKYLPDEIKGVIGNSDMFIGCRMHSTIASTSMGVPTVAIAYEDKFYRIIGKTLGQEEYIVDIRNPSFDELLAELKLKLDSLWKNRDKVREELKERAKIAQQQTLFYGKLIQELVESSKKASA